MSRSQTVLFLSLVVCGAAVIGCDPVTTTVQHVRLSVTDLASDLPCEGANVFLKPPKPPYGLHPSVDALSDESWVERPPRYSGLTDERGLANVEIKVTAIDHSVWFWPRPRDWISGFEYIGKVTRAEKSDVFRLPMRPGKAAVGDDFRVTVVAVDKPQYATKK